MSLVAGAKWAALSLMRGGGAFRLARDSRWRRQRLAILCYHSLSLADEHLWAPALFVSPAHFERRLQWLQERRYCVLGLDEGLKRMAADDLPERAVAITFDDGTADFASLAWPLLERHGLPATVYWTTFYAERPAPVFGMMNDYLLWRGRALRLDAALWGGAGTRLLDTWQAREKVLGEIEDFRKREGLTLAQREELLAAVAAALGVDYAAILKRRTLQVMTPEEAAAAAARGADIQLHTHRHRTPLDRALFHREIADNRARVEKAAGKPVRHFCYPSGKMASEFFAWLRELEIDSAVTCESGLASRRSHPYLLPRIVDTSTLSELDLDAWLSGARLLLGQPKPAGEIVGRHPGRVS
jgi:peptidoglycan/xylan/chitin deacetylase (PgdA/CDA1 family)